jgi:uncharacterized membrane protein YbaN (DUF454 family)
MPSDDLPPKSLNPVLRWALLTAGILAVGFGVLGIFLPVLPTVPLLLLALACFARSSDSFYRWLINHTHLGPLIRPYLQGQGMPRTSKRNAIVLLWISIAISVLFLIEVPWLNGLLLIIALGVTWYLWRLPTASVDDKS